MSLPRMPRLLFVGAFPPPGAGIYGGMVTSCRALLQSSLPSQVELVLVDSTQIGHPPPALPKRLLLAARRFAIFIYRFETTLPDAVILFAAAGASVVEKGAMAWYARLRGRAALIFPRGGPVIDACRRSRLTAMWTRWAFAGARLVLCQGPAWQRFVTEVLRRPAADALLIPNWTATEELLNVGRLRRAGSPDVRLLFVGWLDREKGIEELLEAVAPLAKAGGCHLLLVGEGNASAFARDFVAKHGLTGTVTFKGWLNSDQLRNEYAAVDVFVLPSWSEGLPNAMIEAMASGLAIVVSAVGNVPSAVEDGHSGLLIPPRDVGALRAALTRVIADPGLRSSLGSTAHRVAVERFGVEPAVDKILSAVRYAIQPPLRNGAAVLGETN